ncbi:hypothetical protein [Paenibacillus sp. y28]|uniref:hypothetical protein n=1 Tax=Paenibacillus sp. y28 TaxID=3129110 RepID=UPI0030159D96
MAILNITSIGQTGAQWYISDLSNYWNKSYYKSARVYVNGKYVYLPDAPPMSGTSYSTSWGSITGLSAGTTYSASAEVQALNDSWYSAGSRSFTTQAAPQPPSGRPSVSARALYSSGQHKVEVSWTSVSGATGYNIYANNYYKTSTSTLSATFPVDYEYTVYTIAVTPYNSVGDGSSGTTTVRTLDVTAPVIITLYATDVQKDYITLYASGSDSGSGMSGFEFELYNSSGSNLIHRATKYGGSAYASMTGLSPDTTYLARVRAFDTQLNYSGYRSFQVTTLKNRPYDFDWDISKSPGGGFNLTANEWNRLTSRINEFRNYKGLGNYSFTTAYSGNVFEAYYYRQAVQAINEMNPPTSVPALRYTGDTVYANDINRLRLALNSIT